MSEWLLEQVHEVLSLEGGCPGSSAGEPGAQRAGEGAGVHLSHGSCTRRPAGNSRNEMTEAGTV